MVIYRRSDPPVDRIRLTGYRRLIHKCKVGNFGLIWKIVNYAFALLSIAAGLPKVLRMPQEVGFFAEAGLGIAPLMLLGGLQVAGGILTLTVRFRQIGLFLVIVGFLVSVLVLAMTGDFAFASVSMLPVFVGIGLWIFERRTKGII